MGFERQMYISKDDKKKVSMFPRQIRSLKNSKRDHIERTPVHMNLSLCTQTCNNSIKRVSIHVSSLY